MRVRPCLGLSDGVWSGSGAVWALVLLAGLASGPVAGAGGSDGAARVGAGAAGFVGMDGADGPVEEGAATGEGDGERGVGDEPAEADGVEVAGEDGAMVEVRPAIDALTNDLLDDLEASGRAIETLQAAVIYDRRFLLQGDQHIRTGNLFFESVPRAEGAPTRRFAIAFERLFVAGVMRPETQRFVFDGRWLVERDDANKRFIAREVAPPGASFDPLRLGEGPMPIPLGQRKVDILARYDARATWGGAEWVDADEAARGYRAAVDGARQLVLTPRASFAEADDFLEIRLWYAERDGTVLPVLSRTVSKGGDVAFVRLLAFRVNDRRDAGVQRLEEALRMDPPEEAGWEIQRIEGRWDEQELRRSVGAPGS